MTIDKWSNQTILTQNSETTDKWFNKDILPQTSKTINDISRNTSNILIKNEKLNYKKKIFIKNYWEWLAKYLQDLGSIEKVHIEKDLKWTNAAPDVAVLEDWQLKDRYGACHLHVIVPKNNKSFNPNNCKWHDKIYYYNDNTANKNREAKAYIFPEVEEYLMKNYPDFFIETDPDVINTIELLSKKLSWLSDTFLYGRTPYEIEEITPWLISVRDRIESISVNNKDIRKQKLLAIVKDVIFWFNQNNGRKQKLRDRLEEKIKVIYDEVKSEEITFFAKLKYKIEKLLNEKKESDILKDEIKKRLKKNDEWKSTEEILEEILEEKLKYDLEEEKEIKHFSPQKQLSLKDLIWIENCIKRLVHQEESEDLNYMEEIFIKSKF